MELKSALYHTIPEFERETTGSERQSQRRCDWLPFGFLGTSTCTHTVPGRRYKFGWGLVSAMYEKPENRGHSE
jgi:hypothetical protein